MRPGVVLLFGEVLFDVFPDARRPGGAPLNVACHLGAFGETPRLITRTGADEERAELLEVMRRHGLDTGGVQLDKQRPTGRVLVEPHPDGHRFRILPEQAYDFIGPDDAVRTAAGSGAAVLYFGTLAQRAEVSRRALLALFDRVQATRFLDVNLRTPWYDEGVVRESLRQADIAKLNENEVQQIGRLLSLSGRTRIDIVRTLIERFDLQQVLVTLGARGAWLLQRDGTEHEVAAPVDPTAVVDSVGSGDGFSAVFLLGLLRGWPAGLTLQRADRFARALCGIRGAIPHDLAFYRPWREEWGIENGRQR